MVDAVKKDSFTLKYASERLQNDKFLLELLEKSDILALSSDNKKWYHERMVVLDNIRNQEEKELLQKSIALSDKNLKKLKF